MHWSALCLVRRGRVPCQATAEFKALSQGRWTTSLLEHHQDTSRSRQDTLEASSRWQRWGFLGLPPGTCASSPSNHIDLVFAGLGRWQAYAIVWANETAGPEMTFLKHVGFPVYLLAVVCVEKRKGKEGQARRGSTFCHPCRMPLSSPLVTSASSFQMTLARFGSRGFLARCSVSLGSIPKFIAKINSWSKKTLWLSMGSSKC